MSRTLIAHGLSVRGALPSVGERNVHRPSNPHSDGSSFRAATISRRKPEKPGRKYRRVIAYHGNNSRVCTIPRLYYLAQSSEMREGLEGTGGRRRWTSDQRFKIEQFLIMPALLVIRDTRDGRYRRERERVLPLFEREEEDRACRRGGEKKKREKKSTRARTDPPRSPDVSDVMSAVTYPPCLPGHAARRHIKNPRARRGDLFRKHAELYVSRKT